MLQLKSDMDSSRRTMVAFLAFWLALLFLTALVWDRGIPGWLFLIHLLALPLLAGVTTAGWHLSSGLAGLFVSLADLIIVNAVPMIAMTVSPPPVAEKPLFTGWGAVLELFEFVVLMGVPGYLLGLLGGVVGRRFGERRTG